MDALGSPSPSPSSQPAAPVTRADAHCPQPSARWRIHSTLHLATRPCRTSRSADDLRKEQARPLSSRASRISSPDGTCFAPTWRICSLPAPASFGRCVCKGSIARVCPSACARDPHLPSGPLKVESEWLHPTLPSYFFPSLFFSPAVFFFFFLILPSPSYSQRADRTALNTCPYQLKSKQYLLHNTPSPCTAHDFLVSPPERYSNEEGNPAF